MFIDYYFDIKSWPLVHGDLLTFAGISGESIHADTRVVARHVFTAGVVLRTTECARDATFVNIYVTPKIKISYLTVKQGEIISKV